MGWKKTTVMVDEDDLELIKQAAAREGRPEAEYFREAFHIAALRTKRWGGDWDIPTLDLGGPVREDDIKQAMAGGIEGEQAEIDSQRRRPPGKAA